MWADGSGQDFATTHDNQFLIHAQGGVGIGTNNPQQQLNVAGNVKCSGVQEVSDLRLITDIAPITDASCKIEQIRGVTFRWNKNAEPMGGKPREEQIGIIAQEVEQIVIRISRDLILQKTSQNLSGFYQNKLTMKKNL